MRQTIYIESGVGGHTDQATQAWTLRLAYWGLCGQSADEEKALQTLTTTALDAYREFLSRHGETCPPFGEVEVVVAERIHGDELAFEEDRRPASDEELDQTLQTLAWARSDLLRLLDSTTDVELDWDDSERQMPSWATWRTPRFMAWHIADTESCYYLAAVGVTPPPRPEHPTSGLNAPDATSAPRWPRSPGTLWSKRPERFGPPERRYAASRGTSAARLTPCESSSIEPASRFVGRSLVVLSRHCAYPVGG